MTDTYFTSRDERETDLVTYAQRQVRETWARGMFQPQPIQADEYRDTYATVAEYRTQAFALRVTYDDVEGLYLFTLVYPRGGLQRRFELETASFGLAQQWIARLTCRHLARRFSCRVDY